MKHKCAAIGVAVTLLVGSCFNTATIRYPVDEVIWTPRTDRGRAFLQRHAEDLRGIVTSIQESPQLTGTATIERDGVKLLFKTSDTGDSTWFLGLHLTLAGGSFNTLRTTYQLRAASAYSRVLFPLAAILTQHQSVFTEYQPGGVDLWLDWKIADASVDPYGFAPQTEGMNAWIPDSTLINFANASISIQELARQSKFTSSLGRTELDFSSTH